MSEDEIDRLLAGRHAENGDDDLRFAIWPENLEACELFFALQTQWRVVVGFGGCGYVGLDYPSVESVMRIRRMADRARLFDDIRVMERAALPIRNEKRDG